jgi:hypothetical protein
MLKTIKIAAVTYLYAPVSSNIKARMANIVNHGPVSKTFGVAVLTSIGNNRKCF